MLGNMRRARPGGKPGQVPALIKLTQYPLKRPGAHLALARRKDANELPAPQSKNAT